VLDRASQQLHRAHVSDARHGDCCSFDWAGGGCLHADLDGVEGMAYEAFGHAWRKGGKEGGEGRGA